MISVVDGESGADSTFVSEISKSSNTVACQRSKIYLLIFSTSGQAESKLRVIVVRRHTVGAHSSHEVEVGEAGADATDVLFVESAVGGCRAGRFNGRNPSKSAFSLNKDIALSTVAAGCSEVVSGVGRADIADSSDEVEAMIAFASLISVDFISATDGVLRVELVAVSIFHVEAQDTDTFTENIVVDLVGGAADDVEF